MPEDITTQCWLFRDPAKLYRRKVVVGCADGLYCPTSPVTRGQMGVFMGKGFDLSPYEP